LIFSPLSFAFHYFSHYVAAFLLRHFSDDTLALTLFIDATLCFYACRVDVFFAASYAICFRDAALLLLDKMLLLRITPISRFDNRYTASMLFGAFFLLIYAATPGYSPSMRRHAFAAAFRCLPGFAMF